MDFDTVFVTDTDVTLIREAIRAWGKPSNIVENYGVTLLRKHFLCWHKFVSFDWSEDWVSEYDHDIGCRYWIQLAIEHATSLTGKKLQAQVQPLDEMFQHRMEPAPIRRRASPGPWKAGPYFWETNTILHL